jgi:hypothetical protein
LVWLALLTVSGVRPKELLLAGGGFIEPLDFVADAASSMAAIVANPAPSGRFMAESKPSGAHGDIPDMPPVKLAQLGEPKPPSDERSVGFVADMRARSSAAVCCSDFMPDLLSIPSQSAGSRIDWSARLLGGDTASGDTGIAGIDVSRALLSSTDAKLGGADLSADARDRFDRPGEGAIHVVCGVGSTLIEEAMPSTLGVAPTFGAAAALLLEEADVAIIMIWSARLLPYVAIEVLCGMIGDGIASSVWLLLMLSDIRLVLGTPMIGSPRSEVPSWRQWCAKASA